MGTTDSLSLAIHSTTPAPDCAEPTVALSFMASGSFSAEPRGAQNEFGLIRFDETRHQVFRERRINQRGRMAGRRRGKKADDRFGIDAAEQKDQALSFGGDVLGEIKACVREAPRASASCRCGRHRPPATPRGAGSAEEVRRRRGPNRSLQLWTAIDPSALFPPASYNEAAINPDDLPSHIGREVRGEKQDRVGDILRARRPGPWGFATPGSCVCPRGWLRSSRSGSGPARPR